jgi:hypothetical protein
VLSELDALEHSDKTNCEAICAKGTCTTEPPFKCVCTQGSGYTGERCDVPPPTTTVTTVTTTTATTTQPGLASCAKVTQSGSYELASGETV